MKMKLIFVLIVAIFCVFGFVNGAKPEKCNEPEESGRCLAYMPRFRYNPTTDECVEFIYGGCGGNANRFDSKENCEKECVNVP